MAFRPTAATYAPTQSAVSATQSGAITTDKNAVVGVTQVVNSIEGSKDLAVTLTNTTATAARNVVIFPGVQADANGTRLQEGVTLEAAGFNSREAFLSYFSHIAANIVGMRLETDDTANIEGNSFIFSEKEPDGEERPVKFPVGKYKHDIGGGMYSREVEIPASDLTFTVWAALRMILDKLAPNSSVTLYFNVTAWNKAQNMSALSTSRL